MERISYKWQRFEQKLFSVQQRDKILNGRQAKIEEALAQLLNEQEAWRARSSPS